MPDPVYENDNKPFTIEHTIADGIGAGTWLINKFQGMYIVIKMEDNNRILTPKQIDTTVFYPVEEKPSNDDDTQTQSHKDQSVNTESKEQTPKQKPDESEDKDDEGAIESVEITPRTDQ